MWQYLVQKKTILFILIGLALLAAVPVSLPIYWIHMLSHVLIMALFATSINIEMGYAGMMPLGQAMFLGFGAYSYAILFVKFGFSICPAIIITLIFSIIINTVIGFLCLRGEAFTFGLLHMGFNILSTILITKWISLTGGESGIIGVPRPDIFSDPQAFYLLILAVVVICYLIIWIIMNSPFGRIARGLRENEERLRFLGINTKKYQLTIFIIGGFFSTIAGILLAMLNRGSFSSYLAIILSAQGMMMCIIGGLYNFIGPTLGAAIIVIFGNIVSGYTRQWEGLLGVIMIVCVIGFRGGILRIKKNITQGKTKRQLKPLMNRSSGLSAGETGE